MLVGDRSHCIATAERFLFVNQFFLNRLKMSSANLVTAGGQATSTAKVRADPVPKIRAAGHIIATGGHNADMSIRQEMYGMEGRGNVGTPPHTKKYRKINNMEPG